MRLLDILAAALKPLGAIISAVAALLAAGVLYEFCLGWRYGFVVLVIIGSLMMWLSDWLKERRQSRDHIGESIGLHTQIAQLTATNESLVEEVREIAAKLPQNLTSSGMRESDEELARKTLSLAADMRWFEQQARQAQNSILHRNFGSYQHLTEVERKQRWTQQTQDLLNQSDSERLQFRNNYLGRAVELRNELLKRLGRTVPTAFDPKLIAFQGLLAGPSPVSDAADFLEGLARELCSTIS